MVATTAITFQADQHPDCEVHKGNGSCRRSFSKCTIPLWGWLCPSFHLEGNGGRCGQHNCSVFATRWYVPALTRFPPSYAMKNCWQSVKGHPFASQLKWWESPWMSFLRTPPGRKRSHPQISNAVICASKHHAEQHCCNYFSTYPMLSEEALALLRANCGQGNASAKVEIQRTHEKQQRQGSSLRLCIKGTKPCPGTQRLIAQAGGELSHMQHRKEKYKRSNRLAARNKVMAAPWKRAEPRSCISHYYVWPIPISISIQTKLNHNIHNTRVP